MANRIFRGDAVAISQVVKITPSNPEVGDTFSIIINGKQVDFVATDVLVSTVVDGLVAAWNTAPFPEASLITANAVDEDDDGKSDYLELKADTPGVPFRVDVSTSDAGGFQIEVTTTQTGDPGQNEIQRVSIPSAASGGTFTLTFEGQTTAAIAYNASAGDVETALESLSNIAPGDVVVSGASPQWFVEFAGTYANTNVAALSGNGASLTGAASLTINTITEGRAQDNEIWSFTVPLNAGFWLWLSGSWTRSDGPDGGGFFYGGAGAYLIEDDMNLMFGEGSVVVTKTTTATTKTYTIEFTGSYAGISLTNTLMEFGTTSSYNAASFVTVVQEGNPSATDEVQTVRINGSPTGGTFTLTFQGQTTAGIAYNASAADVKSALEALSNIDLVTVSLSGTIYTVTFQGTNAGMDVGQLTGNASGLTGGAVSVVATQSAISPANERQQVGFSQPPGGGTFSLSWDAGSGIETTSAIAYNASATTVQSALEALATPGSGDFTVTGADGGPWVVEFKGSYAGTDVDSLSGDGSGLTGGGSQGLTVETTVRSRGPNHFDDPDNWTGGSVPNSQDALFFNGGKVHCLYGLKQRVTFTANAGTDTTTFDELADFVEDQAVRLFSTDTLPAGLSTATTYHIKNLDFDAGTCQLSQTAGGAAINITDAGTGTHTIALHLTSIRFHSRWSGYLGLTERNEADYYEYLPRSLSVIVDTITVGEGEGDGQSRLDLDTGDERTTLIVHQSGGSNEAGLPAIRWKGNHADNSVVIHDGEFGAAVYATEEATIDSLVQHAGLVQMGIVTLGSLTKHGGELIAENANLAGSLRLHA